MDIDPPARLKVDLYPLVSTDGLSVLNIGNVKFYLSDEQLDHLFISLFEAQSNHSHKMFLGNGGE